MGERVELFGDRFSSSTSCSKWRRETKPGRLDQSRSCYFLKVATHPTVGNFRTDSLRELKKIKLAWPDLHYATAKGVLILFPSKPAIAPSDHRQLAS